MSEASQAVTAGADDTTRHGHAMPAPAAQTGVLRPLGLYGLDAIEPVLLAALATEEPLLLIGPHGSGKSLLLTRVAEALDLSFRHYNASLLNFDDLVGYPLPGADGQLDYVRTPAAIWGSGAVIFDEISRCRPDIQNKLFPIIHERKVQGLPLQGLRFRWAAMNPPATDEDDNGYAGSEPLDTALADRFAFVVAMPDWNQLCEADQLAIIRARATRLEPAQAQRLTQALARTRGLLDAGSDDQDDGLAAYVRVLVALLAQAGLALSPRRAGMLLRSIRAVWATARVLDPDAVASDAALLALRCGIPQRAQGIEVAELKLLAAHRDAWRFARLPQDDPLKRILCAPDPLERARLAISIPELAADEFSRIIADALAQLAPGAREALAVCLFESVAVGRLNAAIAEQAGERYRQIADAPQFSESLHATQPRFATWSRIKDLLSRLDPASPHDRLRANALVMVFERKELATPEDAERAFAAYADASARLGLA